MAGRVKPIRYLSQVCEDKPQATGSRNARSTPTKHLDKGDARMFKRKRIIRVIGVLLVLCVSHTAYPKTPPPAQDPSASWPKVLLKEVDDVAQTYVDEADDVTKAGSLRKP